MKNVSYIVAFVLLVVFSLKKNHLKEHTVLKKEKLHNYFGGAISHSDNVNREKREFIKDSITDIQSRSVGVEFVEISSFENAISIRCLMKNNSIKNYTYQNSKTQSKHLDTIYISVNNSPNLMDNRFNKLLSFIAFGINQKKEPSKNELLRSYIDSKSDFNVFYFDNVESIASQTLRKKSQYFFDDNGGTSLYLINHLLKNYDFKKFKILKENNFLDFERIYGKSFVDMIEEYEMLGFSTLKKQEYFKYDFYEECA